MCGLLGLAGLMAVAWVDTWADARIAHAALVVWAAAGIGVFVGGIIVECGAPGLTARTPRLRAKAYDLRAHAQELDHARVHSTSR
ncbi:hypothetical protein [Streptomyces monticola]|uniref:hypothetical protein n=1 Tax=Streptomyces monticola TaxID=2666263 RepID=UPI0036D3CDFE